MYIAKIAGYTISPGTDLTIEGVENFRFQVLEVRKDDFRVMWLDGDHAGSKDSIPHSLFGGIGQTVHVFEVDDDTREPNRAFLTKKLKREEHTHGLE